MASRRCSPAAPALAALLLLSLLAVAAATGDGWSYGRATYYGNDGGSTIHEGSCMFGVRRRGRAAPLVVQRAV